MVGLPGDTPVRTDENGYPVNRDVRRRAAGRARGRGRARFRERGLRLQPVRLSVALGRDLESVGLLGGGGQPVLPDSEEFILPIEHGNDRCEWFMQLSDEIVWDIKDKETGAPRAG